MSTAIYYFSGTGNSLFIAKKLNESLENSELLPIVRELDAPPGKIDAEKVVLVFPVYALTVPIPVRDFLKKNDFGSVHYISAVATRLGIPFNDFKRIDRLMKPKKLNSHFVLNMGSNDIKVKNYKCPSERDLMELESAVLKELERISQIINGNEESRERDSSYLEALPFGDFRDRLIEWSVPKMMTFSRFIGGVNYYYINSNCNGCGICSKVCLSGKISMKENRPGWNKKTLCYMCYACVNFCPSKAIEIDSLPGVPSFSCENDRYCHPYAGYKDIEGQKT